jgi:hypothetical protein
MDTRTNVIQRQNAGEEVIRYNLPIRKRILDLILPIIETGKPYKNDRDRIFLVVR